VSWVCGGGGRHGGLDDLPKKKEALDGGRRLRRALGRVGDRHHPHGDRRHGLRQDRRRCPAQIPRSKRGILFGMMLDPFGEADCDYMMCSLPAPVRMLYPCWSSGSGRSIRPRCAPGSDPCPGTAQ